MTEQLEHCPTCGGSAIPGRAAHHWAGCPDADPLTLLTADQVGDRIADLEDRQAHHRDHDAARELRGALWIGLGLVVFLASVVLWNVLVATGTAHGVAR